MLIMALQNVERIFHLPTTKKGISPSFHLPCIRITFIIIDIFISNSWEKLTIRCITTTCTKHFAWWWLVINGGSLLNSSFAFRATGWELGSNLSWIIWVMCHFELLLPYRLLLAPGTPVGLLKSGENFDILLYLSELKSFNSLIHAAVKVILTE